MKKRGLVLLFGLVAVLAAWWFLQSGTRAQPEEGVLDVWATWGDGGQKLQVLFDSYSRLGGLTVRVTTGVKDDEVEEALASSTPPDVVILTANDPVRAYHERGLVEPLDGWIRATGIDLDDIYPAPLGQCTTQDGTHLCLPWGADVEALFWNKDLFRAAGLDPEHPPQTMEELVEIAQKLTVRDQEGKLSQVGFIPDLTRSHAELYAAMSGGTFYGSDGSELIANSQPVIDALEWQRHLYSSYGAEELRGFISSFTPYVTSRHPTYAGRRLSCQQCHRSAPIQNKRVPESGFYEGRIAMMIAGEWLAGAGGLAQDGPQVNVGVVPFPPPAAHMERASTSVVQGPVVLVPAGAIDKDQAAQLVAWMMSPEIVADSACAQATLPTSLTAAQDPRFQGTPGFDVFMDLMAHPNARSAITTPLSQELNEALGQVEEEVLLEGSDPVPLLDEVQVNLGPRLREGLAYEDRP